MAEVNYRYRKTFGTGNEARDVAEYFHAALSGNQDYMDSRILLIWDWHEVLLVEFSDSKTHIHVIEGGDMPVLEMFCLS